MRKIGIGIALSLLTLAQAAADTVTRRSADLYAADDGSVAYATAGCTQTARGMEARVETNRVTGRPHLVFYDAQGEEEGDCQVVAVATRPRVPQGTLVARGEGRRRGAAGSARTHQAARR